MPGLFYFTVKPLLNRLIVYLDEPEIGYPSLPEGK